MSDKIRHPRGVAANGGAKSMQVHSIPDPIGSQPAPIALVLPLLDGHAFAGAIMPWGSPGPIRLPDNLEARAELARAHVYGSPATVTYAPIGRNPQPIRVNALQLIALSPGSDSRCRWIGFDLDAADGHGAGGLSDPDHAARCIAERAYAAGLGDGLIVARSRGAHGRHIFVIPPEPIPLLDGVLATAALAAQAFMVAERDVVDGAKHAFACADGTIAQPGKSGSFELIPPSTDLPRRGWSMACPAAGALAHRGGGIISDPFDDRPVALATVPRSNPTAWATLLGEVRAKLSRRAPVAGPRRTRTFTAPVRDPLAHLDPRTRELLNGRAPEGERNKTAFAAACDLLGRGIGPAETERLVLWGATQCGLPEKEAHAAIKSAMRRKGVRP